MALRNPVLPLLAAAGAALALAPAANAATIASGTLRDAAGQPTMGTVIAYTFPLRGKPVEIARTEAGPTGAYTLAAPDPDLEGRRTSSGGRLDFLVSADLPNGQSAMQLMEDPVSKQATATLRSAPATGDPAPAPAPAPGPVGTDDLSGEASITQGATLRAAGNEPMCDNVGKPEIKAVMTWAGSTVVGEINNAYDDTLATFTYGEQRKAESSIATGITVPIKFKGQDLGTLKWNLGKTTTVRNTGTKVSSRRRGPVGVLVNSRFEFKKYRVTECGLDRIPRVRYVVRPEFWRGGVTTKPQRGTINVCTGGDKYEGMGDFRTDRQVARTFEKGIDISAKIGPSLALTSQSGFSTNVSLAMRFRGKRTHILCGAGGVGSAATGGAVFSGQKK